MFTTSKAFRMLLFSSMFLVLLVLVNLFFYSFVTIALYKLICNESDYLGVLLKSSEYAKISNVFYASDSKIGLSLLGNAWSVYELSEGYPLIRCNGASLYSYYNALLFEIRYIAFFLDHCLLQSTSGDLNLLFLNFFIRASNLNWINSISLQKTIILNLNESGLFFFRIYNPSHLPVKLVTLYMIYPNNITLYVNKIQCFCFNVIFLYPLELIDLPVLIYINPFFFSNNTYINNIIIYYVIFLN